MSNVKRNCWTCSNDIEYDDQPEHGCKHNPMACNDPNLVAWIRAQDMDCMTEMPPKTADNCPGWEPKVTP